MLVQLSPWETSRTSIRVLASSRRRKRGSKGGKENRSCPSFAASMITTASKRSLAKMKVKSAELSNCLPFLTITSEHNITVLGKNLTETEGSSPYREFSSLRYNSRPGDAGSFFAKPSNGKYSPNDLPRIPAILDTKNDRVYALQQGNNKLTCWNSWKSSGPDETSALKIHLDHPALSMRLLPMSKGVIYGSCRNGVIYVARVIGGNMSVEYLEVKRPKGSDHIGTFAEIEVDQARTSGRKRKMSDADGNSSVNFYQVFSDGVSVKIVRNNVSLSASNSDKLIKSGSLVQNTASVGLLGDGLSNSGGQYALDRVELLVSSSGSAPKISVVYTVTTKGVQDSGCGTFCAAISLVNGEISNSPVRLHSQTNQFGLVADTVLAAASGQMIYLYDLMTGSTLQSNSLKRVIRDMDRDDEWVLHTNDKHGILAIFFQKEECLHVALSAAVLDENKASLSSNVLKSSSKLACSLLANSNNKFQYNINSFDLASSKCGDKDTNASFGLIRLDETVARALTKLEETCSRLISKDESCSKTSFREEFNASMSTLALDVSSSIQDRKTPVVLSDSNPQDSSNGELRTPTKNLKNGKLNGKHHSSSSAINEVEMVPTSTPQSFIDGSVQIVLSIIRGERQARNSSVSLSKLDLDARYILKSLIRSKRVSARLHLEGSYALRETEKEHPLSVILKCLEHPSTENPFSALHMVIEMIVNCFDLSERQLVVILDYMMRHAKADDIVATVRYHKAETGTKFAVARHEKQTIIAGLKAVLAMIVGYSECNEAMLRVALVEELSSSTEAILLARMLPKLLVTNPHSDRTDRFARSACQWIAALSESFRDDLAWAKTSSGESYLNLLLDSVEKVTKNSQAVMLLKDSIGVAEMVQKHKKLRARKGMNAPQEEEMWGYLIDHIIF